MEKVVKAAILVDFFSFNKVAGRKSPVILTCGFLPLYFMAVTQVSALEPAAIDAGPFKLVPTLGVQTGHDDNIFLTDSGETDSWITVINPQVKLMAQDGPSSYSITYDLNHGKYHDSSPDDYTDHNLRGDINLELNDKNFLDVEVAYTKNHEPRGTGANQGEDATANAKPVKYDERIFDVTYTYGSREATGRLKLAGGVLDKEYTNFETQNAGRDRSTSYLGGTFYYRVAPKTQALFEVTRKRIDYDLATSPLDSTEMYYLAGATWDATASTSGTVKVGMVEKGFSSATLKDDDSVSWEVSIEWTPLARTSLTLMTAKAPEETDGSGSYIDRTSASLVWSHGWTERFNSRLSAGRRTGNYVNNSRDDDEDNIGIGFTYSMRRWLDLSVDWNYSDRSSSQTGLDYDKNVVYLRADISL